MKAFVVCTKLDACEELRMSRLVFDGGCGEQGNKALSPNKFKYRETQIFFFGETHFYAILYFFLLKISFWICLKISQNQSSVVSGHAFEKYVFILR